MGDSSGELGYLAFVRHKTSLGDLPHQCMSFQEAQWLETYLLKIMRAIPDRKSDFFLPE